MSGKIIQCKNCRKLFQSLGSDFCPSCVDDMEMYFIKVKDYIYDHPETNVMDISEGTDVSEKMVLYFLKEGRLSLGDQIHGLECELCGASISSGRFCRKCQGVFESAFKSTGQQPEKKQEAEKKSGTLGRMHFDYKGK